jgi:putative nucleotidyltransferase with HDIG domain
MMPKALKLYIAGLVTLSAIALVGASLICVQTPGYILGMRPEIAVTTPATETSTFAGLCFWIALTLLASAFPVRMPRGTVVSVSMAPIVAAAVLGGPAAAGWVALLGTTELRELRGRVPWYGSLFNHAGIVLPVVLGGLLLNGLRSISPDPSIAFLATMAGAFLCISLNVVITAIGVTLRDGEDFRLVLIGDARGYTLSLFALAPLAWLMAQVYELLPGGTRVWATLLFALPLYSTRDAQRRYVEMRDMFTQTIGALAEAVDKRDPFTSKHSRRVMEIASDIGQVMHCNDAEMEALEWGGLLHDVGKIGVPDHVLLKPDRLTKDERTLMNSHPVLGAEIIAQVTKLAPELPIIRHHHEWYNGSGYPDRLIGEEIPKLARVLHVADAFEAMTAKRPYRMTPLTDEQALAELRKFAGIQFDPEVVDAFVRTKWVEGIRDPGRGGESETGPIRLRPLPPLIGEHGAASSAPGTRASDSR